MTFVATYTFIVPCRLSSLETHFLAISCIIDYILLTKPQEEVYHLRHD